MTPTDIIIPNEVFNFTGQSTIGTWNLKGRFLAKGWSGYDKWSVDEIILCMQRIRELGDSFPFWQRIKETGNEFFFDVVYCGYVEIYKSTGMKELGSVLSYSKDFPFTEGFNPI